MAYRPKLEIDGVQYPNVLEVSYEIRTATDETGRPSDRAHIGLIKVLRTADEKTDLARWASNSDRDSWKSGKITFEYIRNCFKEISFESAFISRYEERVAHVENKKNQQIVEYFEISCGKLDFSWEGKALSNAWEDA